MDRTLCTKCEQPHEIIHMNEDLVCEWCQTDDILSEEQIDG